MSSISELSARYLRRLIILLNIVALLICTTGQAAAQTKVTYFHNDLAGNPVAASDSTGQIIWRESYRPYGERLKNEAASQTNSQWYTGHRQDADTGLVYMGARHYDPLMGRFLSVDPAGFSESNPHSFNRYAYANNNPVKYTDPDGRFAQAIAVGGGLLVAGTVFYVTTTSEQRQQIADGFRALGRQFSNLLNATVENGQGDAPTAGTKGSDQGCIYCVKGDKTKSGKDYVGSTDDLNQRAKDKSDGRDRDGAEVVDTYTKGDVSGRRSKEQQAINDRGGKEKLDNKRNEVAEPKWPSMGVSPP